MKNWTEKEIGAGKKLLCYFDFETDDDTLQNNITHGYLTINNARNGKMYVYYFDGNKEAIIDIETNEIITDKNFIEEQFC